MRCSMGGGTPQGRRQHTEPCPDPWYECFGPPHPNALPSCAARFLSHALLVALTLVLGASGEGTCAAHFVCLHWALQHPRSRPFCPPLHRLETLILILTPTEAGLIAPLYAGPRWHELVTVPLAQNGDTGLPFLRSPLLSGEGL
jgi:hypothetical protein